MYIHLGGDMILRSNKIIAILDKETKDLSEENKRYFNAHKEKKNIISVSDEEPMSIVITDDEIYYSPISSFTLRGRAEVITEIETENRILYIDDVEDDDRDENS